MKKKLIINAITVNEGIQSKNDILVEGDKITQIKPNIELEIDVEVIDAKGFYILPGLIDDQVHFREPGLTHKGSIQSESKAAVAGGITSYIEMPNTIPQTTTKVELDKKFQIASNTSAANFSFLNLATKYSCTFALVASIA